MSNTINNLGKFITETIQITSGATNGYVLTSDASGNASWQASSGGSEGFTGGTVSGTTTFTGGISATTISATTIGTSGDCVDDLYVTNIHSCSPLNINPLDEGNVYFGSTSGVTIDVANSRLGIGTDAPTYPIEVLGNNSIFWYDPTSVGGNLIVSGNTGLPRFGGANAPYLTKPSTGWSMGMRCWDDVTYPGYGKVGDMHIYAGTATNGINVINAPGTGTDDYIRFYAGIQATSTSDIHIQGSGSTRGYVGVGIETPSAKLHINNTTSGNSFLVEDSTNPDSSPFVIDNAGNVAIGTTSPTSGITLDVNGGIRSRVGNGIVLLTGNETAVSGTPLGDGIRISYENDLFGSNSDGLVFEKTDFNNTTPDGGIMFANIGSGGTRVSAMSIRGNGYIGINNDNPTYRLDITGTTGRLFYDGDTDRNAFRQSQVINQGPSTGITAISIISGNEGDGHSIEMFGIGTGTSNSASWRFAGEPGDVALYASTRANNLNIMNGLGSGTTDNIRFYVGSSGNITGQTPAMIILGSGSTKGNIGIGTETPTEMLHIKNVNAARIKIDADTDNFGETGNAEILMSQDGGITTANISLTPDAVNDLMIGVNSATGTIPDIRFNTRSDGTVFTTSADTKMIIKNDGKVGIGTDTPSEKLEVSGKTKTTNFQMTSGATNGYVLTSDASGNATWQASTGGGVSIDPYNNVGNTGTSFTWNVSGLSTNYQVTLTANTTLNLTNVRNGDYGTIIVTQDVVGSRTITFGTVNGGAVTHRVANGGAGTPLLTANASAIDILTFTYNGSTMFWTVGNDYT